RETPRAGGGRAEGPPLTPRRDGRKTFGLHPVARASSAGKRRMCQDRGVKLAIAALLALSALCAHARGNTSHFVDKLSCDAGPYGLRLPETYKELRKIAPLKAERLVRQQDLGPYKARY